MDDWDLFEVIYIEDMSSIITLGAVAEARDLREESGLSKPILSGGDYLRDLLNCGNHKRIYLVLRMQKDTFDKLCLWMRRGRYLKDSKRVLVEQQVAMFLWVITYGASTIATCERFRITVEPLHR
jgi:hypothetical protein